MPALLLWPLIAGGVGLTGGFILGSKAQNLAVVAAGSAAIIYMLKGK